MSKFILIPMENDTRHYLNTDLIRSVQDQKEEGSVVIEYDTDHKIYLSRERAAPLLKWLKSEIMKSRAAE